MTLTLIILLPFLGALVAAFLPSNARNAESWLGGFVTLSCTALVASLHPEVSDAVGAVVRDRYAWAPQLGLEVYFRMDGFASCMRGTTCHRRIRSRGSFRS
jgi:multicomponent K+:H+ antiporter subunit A